MKASKLISWKRNKGISILIGPGHTKFSIKLDEASFPSCQAYFFLFPLFFQGINIKKPVADICYICQHIFSKYIDIEFEMILFLDGGHKNSQFFIFTKLYIAYLGLFCLPFLNMKMRIVLTWLFFSFRLDVSKLTTDNACLISGTGKTSCARVIANQAVSCVLGGGGGMIKWCH